MAETLLALFDKVFEGAQPDSNMTESYRSHLLETYDTVCKRVEADILQTYTKFITQDIDEVKAEARPLANMNSYFVMENALKTLADTRGRLANKLSTATFLDVIALLNQLPRIAINLYESIKTHDYTDDLKKYQEQLNGESKQESK